MLAIYLLYQFWIDPQNLTTKYLDASGHSISFKLSDGECLATIDIYFNRRGENKQIKGGDGCMTGPTFSSLFTLVAVPYI